MEMVEELPKLQSSIQPACLVHSWIPSGPHSAVGEEFAEVHFGVATLGQELLCCVLEFFVVLKNFGGKKLLLQFI